MTFDCIYEIMLGIFYAVLLPFAVIYDIIHLVVLFIKWLVKSHKAEIEKDIIKS